VSRQAGALAASAGVAGLGVVLLLGARTIPGEASYAGVGPRIFPVIVGTALVLLGGALLVAVRRGLAVPEPPALIRGDALPWILGGLAGAIWLLERLGFPVAAGFLFVCAARGFGSRRWPGNVLLGAVLGVLIYLAFSRGLGVSLPGGPFERP